MWVKRGKNFFDEIFRQGSHNNTTSTTRVFNKNNIPTEEGTYIISSNLPETFMILLGYSTTQFPLLSTADFTVSSGWNYNGVTTITTTGDGYLGVMVGKKDGSNITPEELSDYWFMLNKGEVALPHESHVGTTINIKENGSFGEILNVDEINANNNYSSSEQKIGTWIDGKPLYRKVIDFGALPNNTTKGVSTGLSVYTVEQIVNLHGIAMSNNGAMPIPYVGRTNLIYGIEMSIGSNFSLVNIMTGSDRSSLNAYVIIEYTKKTN